MDAVKAIRSGKTDAATFEALVSQWGNPFSFRAGGLARLHELALKATRPILDLGAGLSSIVLGLAAEKSGVPVHSLDNAPEWAERTQQALYAHSIETVSLHLCRLSGGFYALPDALPREFGLVFIDGPQDLAGRGRAYEALNLTGADVVADDIRIREIARPFDLWVLASGRAAERCGNYAIARKS